MDWLQFIAAIAGSFAWPITLIVAFFVIESHLRAICPFVERLKYKDLEVEFRNSVQELAEKSRTALPPPEPDDQSSSPRNRLYTLADIPRVPRYWKRGWRVEAAAAEVLQSGDPTLANLVVEAVEKIRSRTTQELDAI